MMRVLILGWERVSQHLIPLLAAEGHRVAIIYYNSERVEAIANQENVEVFPAREPLMDNLRQAGVGNVDVFLALTSNDNRNAMAAQVAQHVFHVPKVICRIDDPSRQRVYEELGMSVVSATASLAETIHSTLKAQ